MGLGALACAAAPVSAVFVGARIVQGLGGAAVLACGLAVLAHSFTDPARRSHATGVWGASVGLGIAAGRCWRPGLDIGTGWREVYALTGALVLVLVVPSARMLGESAAAHPRRIDVPGILTLAGGLTLLVAGLTQARSGLTAGRSGCWRPRSCCWSSSSWWSGGSRAHDRARAARLAGLPRRHGRRPGGGPGHHRDDLQRAAAGAGRAGRQPLGGHLAGVRWAATSTLTSLLVRRVRIPLSGPDTLAVALVVVGVGQLLGLGLGVGSSPWRLLPSMVVAGLATGVLNAVLGREAVAGVPPDRAAMGSGTNNTARYLGAACGITLFSVLLGHAGSGTGAAALVDGWSTAVWVSVAMSWGGAAAVAVGSRRRALVADLNSMLRKMRGLAGRLSPERPLGLVRKRRSSPD